ncbi:MAG: Cof-type HAD-IIB family hydrolase [Candidatus Cloacimonetes bacterium]|nr:Cof-type HAD-IIB family hydrolase [Candidatus Cloacimonadota bacterium]
MKRNKIKIIFTDLDRTLLKDNNTISARNLTALKNLKESGIVTVIATGRHILSSRKVLSTNLPFDYLMFSSGCGIMDWKSQETIYENHLTEDEVKKVLQILLTHKVDFMLHESIPENHRFQYKRVNENNFDLERRIKLYEPYAVPLQYPPQKASQFVVILPSNSDEKFENIKKEIDFLKVIRATSPLDHKSIWLEVFPRNVSKGHSAEWLCKKLGINKAFTLGIGNDFNDIDLLEWTAQSYVVENSPNELKEKYNIIASNQKDGFAGCVEKLSQFDKGY